jgi:eukaryotic-like serine/threonine-protein kinase
MVLKKGATVGAYRLTSDLSSKDAGTSMWGFAERKDVEYFIKQHTSPKYPMPGSPGSASVVERRRSACDNFYQRKQRLSRELAKVGRNGTIVTVEDVFLDAPFYYTVTHKVDTTGVDPDRISKLALADQLVIMATSSKALEGLHSRGLIHGDVKVTNVLIRRTDTSFAARLIDFDNAFFEDDVPDGDLYGGTPEYFAPEALDYLKGDSAVQPTMAVDVFALGLLFCEWLTGAKPRSNRAETRSLAEGLRMGGVAVLPDSKNETLNRLIAQMLQRDPLARPTMHQVNDTIKSARTGRSMPIAAPPSIRPAAPSAEPESGSGPSMLRLVDRSRPGSSGSKAESKLPALDHSNLHLTDRSRHSTAVRKTDTKGPSAEGRLVRPKRFRGTLE